MERYTVAVLVHNQFGVLNRVTSMFRRRQFNIICLTVSETESPALSRITVMFEGEENTKQQLINQLYKLPDVCSVQEYNNDNAVSRELLLIKMQNTPQEYEEIHAAAVAFHAATLDYTREYIILQLTDESRRIDDFIRLMSDFTILEICRTGIVSLERGNTTIRKVTNL